MIVDLTAISMPELLTHFTGKRIKKEKNSKKKTQITKKWWRLFAEHIFAIFATSIQEMASICLELGRAGATNALIVTEKPKNQTKTRKNNLLQKNNIFYLQKSIFQYFKKNWNQFLPSH